jgi:predicted DNA-binding transcriptional regulator AlpA
MADTLLRFRDLKGRRIVSNHVTLKRWIETQGFPPGMWLGPNTLVWREADIEAWLQSRPRENKTRLKGVAKKAKAEADARRSAGAA